jgi:hypothetical protein
VFFNMIVEIRHFLLNRIDFGFLTKSIFGNCNLFLEYFNGIRTKKYCSDFKAY